MYLHFTTVEDAAAIVASGVLELSRTIVDAVYAAVVGGENVPGVQHSRAGYAVPGAGRVAAVLFDVDVLPDEVWPEEVIWRRDRPLPLVDPVVVDVDVAIASLDGSLGLAALLSTDAYSWLRPA